MYPNELAKAKRKYRLKEIQYSCVTYLKDNSIKYSDACIRTLTKISNNNSGKREMNVKAKWITFMWKINKTKDPVRYAVKVKLK